MAEPTQTRRKRTRKAKPRAEAAHQSPGSMDNDTAEDIFEDEDEKTPQLKAKRGRRVSNRSRTPTSPVGRGAISIDI